MISPRARRLLGLWVIAVLVTVVQVGRPAQSLLATQSVDPTPPGPLAGLFTYGMFVDANLIRGPDDFQLRVQDLQARSFTSILFTNNVMDRDEQLLDVADQLGFRVIFAPQGDLRHQWWLDDVPATIEAARNVIYPIAQRSSRHESLLGYSILDDAPNRLANKAALAVQAFREADPLHPASPVFIANNDAPYISSRPDVILTYHYSVVAGHQPCDLASTRRQDGYDEIVSSIRHVAQLARGQLPMWFILQAHGSTRGTEPTPLGGSPLREPTVEEIRLQHWLALGEGVKGIFWFAYDTEQFWTGLRDNPPLFAEVTNLAERTAPLAGLLGQLTRIEDRFGIASLTPAGAHHEPYVSTLQTGDGALYVVAANRSCNPAMLTVTSATVPGQLRDVEQDTRYDLASPIPFRGGDGRLFEVIE